MIVLRNAILEKIQNITSKEEGFLKDVDLLVKQEGDQVYSALLNIFTQLDYPAEEAKNIWNEILEQQKSMSAKLDRPVNLLTAVCDYFITVRQVFQNPKVVEMRLFEEAHHSSKCDPLTALYNRSYFAEALSGEISRSKRQGSEFSILFIDLDNFKEINDTLGHQAGDLALVRMAEMIRQEKRAEDVAARYGGEEFVVLLPGTNKVNALIKAERIRMHLEELEFEYHQHEFRVTLSGGVASYPLDATVGEELVACSDKAMYKAKTNGKNRIELYSSDKRQFTRVDFGGPVRIHELGSAMSLEHFTGKSKDLSFSGMLFESESEVKLGSRVQCQIPIPNPEHPIVVIGTVVRVEKMEKNYDIGISFVQMEKSEKDEINRYFQNNLNPQPFLP